MRAAHQIRRRQRQHTRQRVEVRHLHALLRQLRRRELCVHRHPVLERNTHRDRAHVLTQHQRHLIPHRRHFTASHQHVCRADGRMPSERHFEFRREDAHPPRMRRILRRENERRLRVVELPRDRLQRLGRQPLGAEHHGQLVAGERFGGEDVAGDITEGSHECGEGKSSREYGVRGTGYGVRGTEYGVRGTGYGVRSTPDPLLRTPYFAVTQGTDTANPTDSKTSP